MLHLMVAGGAPWPVCHSSELFGYFCDTGLGYRLYKRAGVETGAGPEPEPDKLTRTFAGCHYPIELRRRSSNMMN